MVFNSDFNVLKISIGLRKSKAYGERISPRNFNEKLANHGRHSLP